MRHSLTSLYQSYSYAAQRSSRATSATAVIIITIQLMISTQIRWANSWIINQLSLEDRMSTLTKARVKTTVVDLEVVVQVAQALPTLVTGEEAKGGTTVVVTQVTFSQVEAIRAGRQQQLILWTLLLYWIHLTHRDSLKEFMASSKSQISKQQTLAFQPQSTLTQQVNKIVTILQQ